VAHIFKLRITGVMPPFLATSYSSAVLKIKRCFTFSPPTFHIHSVQSPRGESRVLEIGVLGDFPLKAAMKFVFYWVRFEVLAAVSIKLLFSGL
jgi:hypothetical protein